MGSRASEYSARSTPGQIRGFALDDRERTLEIDPDFHNLDFMAARYPHLSKQFLADTVSGLDAVFGNLRYQDVTRPAGLTEAVAVND